LLCTCKDKSSCSQGCVCAEQNLTCNWAMSMSRDRCMLHPVDSNCRWR
jgi:hypothetical protein